MSGEITYKFVANRETTGGCEQKFFIPGKVNSSVPNFADLAVKSITINEVVMPVEFFNVTAYNNTGFCNLGETLVNFTGYNSSEQFIADMNFQTGGAITLVSSTLLEDGFETTGYRLKIDYTDGLIVNHVSHPAAKYLGLEEITRTGSGSYIFRLPLDNASYELQRGNNRINLITTFEDETTTENIFDIPPGNYPAADIAAQIESYYQATDTFVSLLVTYDSITNTFLFVQDEPVENPITTVTIKANKLIGFYEDYTYTTTSPGYFEVRSPYPIDIRLTTNVHIKSNQLGRFSVNRRILYPDDKTIIAIIPVDKNYEEVIYYKPTTILLYNNPISFRYIDITLVDDQGKVIDLNGFYWSITMTFNYINSIPI